MARREVVGMLRVLSCPGGHQWEEADESAARGGSLSGPVCGLASTVTALGIARPAANDGPTVLQNISWQSIAALGATDQPPPALPDFEILEEIGRGGMGIVYRARQLGDGQI